MGQSERSALHAVLGNCAGGDPRWWLRRQIVELLDQEPEFRLRLGVRSEQHLAPVGGRQLTASGVAGAATFP